MRGSKPVLPLGIAMAQFEVVAGCLTVVETTRYDLFYGFRRVLKRLY